MKITNGMKYIKKDEMGVRSESFEETINRLWEIYKQENFIPTDEELKRKPWANSRANFHWCWFNEYPYFLQLIIEKLIEKKEESIGKDDFPEKTAIRNVIGILKQGKIEIHPYLLQ